MRIPNLVLLLAACAAAQTPSNHTSAHAPEEAAIRSVVEKYVAARDQIDPKAVAALFTADADQLVSSGEWRRGLDAVVKGTMASSQASSGKRTLTVETVRFISNDVAIVDGRYEIAGGGAGGQDRKMWSTFMFRRTPQGWKIAAIRNMLPAAPAGR